MKKPRKTFLIILFLLLVLTVVFVSNLKLARTQDAMIDMLRQNLHLAKNDGTSISYAGEFVVNENALLWFSIQKEYETYYRAVECRLLKKGGYLLKNIYKPMTYAQDIVHIVWKAEDVFLINNSDCRAIVCKDIFDNVISKTEISSDDIPYVFLLRTSVSSSTWDFLDITGNSVR